MAFTPEERRLMDRLAGIHDRINRLADEEARSALVGGWAAKGGLMQSKDRLTDEAERILDQLIGVSNSDNEDDTQ